MTVDRCPRCAKPVFNDRGELHCLSCGELTRPDILERSRAWAAEEEAKSVQQRAQSGRSPRKPYHAAEVVGSVPSDAMAALAAEFGDLPQEAWDQACSIVPSWRGVEHMRAALERARDQVEAGTFRLSRYREDGAAIAPASPDTEPSAPVDWIGWRLRRGMAISQDILERELRLSWWEASAALTEWRQRLEREASGQ